MASTTNGQSKPIRSRGRPRTLSVEQELLLVEHVKAHQLATQGELSIWVAETFGVSIDRVTVAKVLTRYGYKALHRLTGEGIASGHPSRSTPRQTSRRRARSNSWTTSPCSQAPHAQFYVNRLT